jgi:hypothetical protein
VYRAVGEQSARVDVDAPAPSIVLVRTVFDPNWQATVDGRPVQVLAANFVDQGIPVPAGRHIIVLAYRDPRIGQGLVGSALALAALFSAAAVVHRRRRHPGRPSGEG